MIKNKGSNIVYKNNAQTNQYLGKIIKHVVIFGIDGLGGYAFKKLENNFFKKILKDSLYTYEARNVYPTQTAQNWATIFTGSTVAQHGYVEWYSDFPELPPVIFNEYNRYPTIFYLLHSQKEKQNIASFFTWEGIGNLYEKEIFQINQKNSDDQTTIFEAGEYFVKYQPTLMNITLDGVDHAGHHYGHNTTEYFQTITKTENLFYAFRDKLAQNKLLENTLIIICADHGGFKKGHGLQDANDRVEYAKLAKYAVEVPIIFYNKNLHNKGKIARQLFNWDIAPTIAQFLNLKVPELWIGKSVTELFN